MLSCCAVYFLCFAEGNLSFQSELGPLEVRELRSLSTLLRKLENTMTMFLFVCGPRLLEKLENVLQRSDYVSVRLWSSAFNKHSIVPLLDQS